MKKALQFIASLGLNPQFVAGCAHFFFAYAVTLTFGRWYVAAGIIGYAALKEFWFDAVYEKQPFLDNLEDFLEYTSGSLAGLLAWYLVS